MFLGHYAAALAGKRFAPRASLGVLFAAAQWPDLIWPVFLLLGWERAVISPGDTVVTPIAFTHYPWTHSLAATAVWSVAVGLAYRSWTGDRTGALVVGLLVLSHWALDFVVHRPDLPLYPGGGTRVGLGAWNSVAATVALEAGLTAAGVGVYGLATRAADRTGRLLLWGMVTLLVLVYLANLTGPPPPSVTLLAWVALAAWLFPMLGAWVDRHRVAANPPPP